MLVVVVACTPTSGSSTSMEQVSVSSLVGFPCISDSGEMTSDTRVTVQAGGGEVAAVMGWVSAEPCSGDGPGVVADGFFEGVEDAVVGVEIGDRLRVRAPGFDAAHLEASWNREDGAGGVLANSRKLEPGVWEIVDIPHEVGSHVLNLRFEYGEDFDAAFAITVDIRS